MKGIFRFFRQARPKPLIIAHGGTPDGGRRNTRRGLQRCSEIGLKVVELDLRINRGDEIVACRPSTHPLKKSARYPRLRVILSAFPDMFFMLDLKDKNVGRLVKELGRSIRGADRERVVFYSTESSAVDLARKALPWAAVFEKRAVTRVRLLENLLFDGKWRGDRSVRWVGFEFRRKLSIAATERIALGAQTDSFQRPIKLWDKDLVRALRRKLPNAAIVVFGVDSGKDFDEVAGLGVDAVMSDHAQELIESS